jgi:CRP/FNR family transcriptional regulator, cyclic AMP receptor protein
MTTLQARVGVSGPARDHSAQLSGIYLFHALSPDALRILSARVRTVNYRPGTIVFSKDDPGQTCFIILEGLVKIYVTSEDGQEVVLSILKAGEVFGELSLLDGVPRSASAIAMETTRALALNRGDFLEFVKETPEAAMAVLSVLSGRLRQADATITDAAFLDLPTRVAKKLLELGEGFGRKVGPVVEINIKLRQQDFAAMVSATRESVNRSLSALEEEGIIKVDRQKITLLKPHVLRERVEY